MDVAERSVRGSAVDGRAIFDGQGKRALARTRERNAIEERVVLELSAHGESDVCADASSAGVGRCAKGRAVGAGIRKGRCLEDRGSGVEMLGVFEVLMDPGRILRRTAGGGKGEQQGGQDEDVSAIFHDWEIGFSISCLEWDPAAMQAQRVFVAHA